MHSATTFITTKQKLKIISDSGQDWSKFTFHVLLGIAIPVLCMLPTRANT